MSFLASRKIGFDGADALDEDALRGMAGDGREVAMG